MQAKKTILPFIFFTFLLCTTCSFSQTRKIDSLKSALLYAKEDTNKFRLYYNIAGEYWIGLKDTIDYPNTYKYEDSAIQLARKLNYTYGIFDALMCYGNVYAYQEKYLESSKYYNQAIETAKLLGDKKIVGDSYLEAADNFFAYGNDAKKYRLNFPISLDFNFNALKTYESIGNKYYMAKSWLKIGRTYSWQNFFSMGKGNSLEVEKCGLKALQLFEDSKIQQQVDIISCKFLLGRANYFQRKYAKALTLFYECVKYYKDSSDKVNLSSTYLNIGRIYRALGDSSVAKGNKEYAKKMFTEALKYLGLSLDLHMELNYTGLIALCYAYIGDVEVSLRMFKQADEHLKKAIVYTEKLKERGSYQEIYLSLAKLDSAQGKFRLAMQHYNMYMQYKEKSINEESIIESLLYKEHYEFDKKEDSLKQKQIVAETRLMTEKKQKYFYWTGLGLLSLLSFLGYRNFQNQKKINRLAADAYAKERTELELQSLRAQLNPHFIFNCINSIDAFIHSNDKYNATVYLNKFARLLRNILDSSKLTTVSFTKDIDTLKLYVELEELRHENKFRTEFSIDDGLLINDYKVPALIIQPFVENAILHGLKNREDNSGLLQIEIKKITDKIEYTIKDNGIGREAAGLIAQNKESSYGMQMSYDRIKLFNKEEKPSVEITDLYNNSIAAGTEVKVLLNII